MGFWDWVDGWDGVGGTGWVDETGWVGVWGWVGNRERDREREPTRHFRLTLVYLFSSLR